MENEANPKLACRACGGTGRRATAVSAKGRELERHERRGTPCPECGGRAAIPPRQSLLKLGGYRERVFLKSRLAELAAGAGDDVDGQIDRKLVERFAEIAAPFAGYDPKSDRVHLGDRHFKVSREARESEEFLRRLGHDASGC